MRRAMSAGRSELPVAAASQEQASPLRLRAAGVAQPAPIRVPARRGRTLNLLRKHDLPGLVAIDDCGVPGPDSDPTAAPMPPVAPSLVLLDGRSFDEEGIDGMLTLAGDFVRSGARLWVSRGVDPDVHDLPRGPGPDHRLVPRQRGLVEADEG